MTPQPEVPTDLSRTIHYQSQEPDKKKLFERTGLEELRALAERNFSSQAVPR
ncbi:MAG: hypothetical protein ABI563_20125 [Specibacter sp.]